METNGQMVFIEHKSSKDRRCLEEYGIDNLQHTRHSADVANSTVHIANSVQVIN